MQHMNHPIAETLMGDMEYKRLVQRHERLEAQLMERQRGPLVDWDGVRVLKRHKLQVAEAMEAIRRSKA